MGHQIVMRGDYSAVRMRAGSGRDVQLHDGREHRGVGSAERWRGRAGVAHCERASLRGDRYLAGSMRTAISISRPGGAVGRVGVPQDETMPASRPAFYNNVTVSGGPAPVRAYIEEILPDVLEGRIEPGRVLDRVIRLDEVPEGYRAMNEREAIKVMVEI